LGILPNSACSAASRYTPIIGAIVVAAIITLTNCTSAA